MVLSDIVAPVLACIACAGVLWWALGRMSLWLKPETDEAWWDRQ